MSCVRTVGVLTCVCVYASDSPVVSGGALAGAAAARPVRACWRCACACVANCTQTRTVCRRLLRLRLWCQQRTLCLPSYRAIASL
jgi:hypothetical protein